MGRVNSCSPLFGKNRCILIFWCLLFVAKYAYPQPTFPVNGPKTSQKTLYALTGLTVIPEPGKVLKNATVLIQENKIVEVGTQLKIPANAVVYDYKGLYAYPGFIDIYSSYGINRPTAANKEATKKSARTPSGNWNEAIKSETDAALFFKINSKEAEELRALGFSVVITHVKDGIMRGTSLLAGLGDNIENRQIIKSPVFQHLSFDKGSSSTDYPSSLMGVIALIRQTYLDAEWYRHLGQTQEFNASLEAINKLKHLPSVFECNSVFNCIRAQKISDEFNVEYILKSGGDDYKRIEEIKRPSLKLILPLNFPDIPDIKEAQQLREINLSDLKHWELAPYNPAIVYENKIPFAFTIADLKEKNRFNELIRKAIRCGLPADEALRALTVTPAEWAGVSNILGKIQKNYLANLIISHKPIFDEKCVIIENWVLGEKYILNAVPDTSFDGKYQIKISEKSYEANLKGFPNLKGNIKQDSSYTEVSVNIKNQATDIKLSLTPPLSVPYLGSGWIVSLRPLKIKGIVQQLHGKPKEIEISFIEPVSEKKEKKDADTLWSVRPQIWYPFTAYGFKTLPKPETVLIKNALVWTNTATGIKKMDVVIDNGKIADLGENITSYKNAVIINAEGKHLTCGIIDEHSHIAIVGGVNEGTQENTAEVRIGDVINSEDINIYRQLAGGVTAAQLLHGSANPIGGQSALIKFRWGQSQEKLKIENAAGFIKFALGENVKQSNWGPGNRYPKTRMGVEQVFVDAFIKAREYEKKIKTSPPATVRKDLELEAILEILNKKRFITCHSYVQSEINMLMHVADSFKFKVNTFTHVLEGYKVADKMKRHGAYASTFSDWWAYKFEVNDAIPYNAALLTRAGVCTAINSDNAEMARRLNQEAAKTIKYGGLSEEEAWKTVTLNPARMLKLDSRMGTIEKGKDADIVLWSDNPLSVYAKAEKTWVDGVRLFDSEQNRQLTKAIEEEKLRILAKINVLKKQGEKTEKVKLKKQELYHCDTEGALE